MPFRVETIKPSRIILLFIGLLILMGLVAYVVTEFNYQVRINSLKNEVNKVWQDVVKPTSGVESSQFVGCPFWIDTVGWYDTGPCPRVSKYWFVPIDRGGELEFIQRAVQKEGLPADSVVSSKTVNSVEGGGVKDHVVIKLSLTPVTHEKIPYSAPADKEWRIFSVEVNK